MTIRDMGQGNSSGTFDLTPMQGRWMRKARRIATNTLRPAAAEIDRAGAYPRENLRLLNQEGLLSLPIPKEKGGEGADIGTVALVLQEIAKGCASTAMCACMHVSTVPIIAALAKDSQVEAFVEPLIRGELIGASATSEAGTGSRIWHSQGYAERCSEGYHITASKSFITGAGEADFYLAPVRSHEMAKPDDMSLFVITRQDCAEIRPDSTWDAMGFRGTASSPMTFRDLFVPKSALLGKQGIGFSMMVCFHFPLYHVALSSVFVGIAQAALDEAIAHVQQRDKGSHFPLAASETIQTHVGEMRMRVAQAKSMLARVAYLTDRALKAMLEIAEIGLAEQVTERMMRGDEFFVEVATLKAVATECAVHVSNLALQVCGGSAYKRGHPLERHYRDARAGALMALNNDLVRQLVGKQLLGHPFPWEEEVPGSR